MAKTKKYLNQYFKFPNKLQSAKIGDSFQELNKMRLTINDYSDDPTIGFVIKESIRNMVQNINNKLGEVHLTFLILRNYFNMGIPDDPLFISPGEGGVSIQFLPNFNNEHHLIKYWYDFFADVFYHKTHAALDLLCHLINEYYQYDIEPDINFRKKVMSKLKIDNRELYDEFNRFRNIAEVKISKKLRDDFTHNIAPVNPGLGYRKTETSNRMTIEFGTMEEYIHAKEIIDNAESMIREINSLLKIINELLSVGP